MVRSSSPFHIQVGEAKFGCKDNPGLSRRQYLGCDWLCSARSGIEAVKPTDRDSFALTCHLSETCGRLPVIRIPIFYNVALIDAVAIKTRFITGCSKWPQAKMVELASLDANGKGVLVEMMAAAFAVVK